MFLNEFFALFRAKSSSYRGGSAEPAGVARWHVAGESNGRRGAPGGVRPWDGAGVALEMLLQCSALAAVLPGPRDPRRAVSLSCLWGGMWAAAAALLGKSQCLRGGLPCGRWIATRHFFCSSLKFLGQNRGSRTSFCAQHSKSLQCNPFCSTHPADPPLPPHPLCCSRRSPLPSSVGLLDAAHSARSPAVVQTLPACSSHRHSGSRAQVPHSREGALRLCFAVAPWCGSSMGQTWGLCATSVQQRPTWPIPSSAILRDL